jgi:hypothetical protein
MKIEQTDVKNCNNCGTNNDGGRGCYLILLNYEQNVPGGGIGLHLCADCVKEMLNELNAALAS